MSPATNEDTESADAKTDLRARRIILLLLVLALAGILAGVLVTVLELPGCAGDRLFFGKDYCYVLRPSHITVGAYYYPWHGDDFHDDGGYLREYLNQSPFLGKYDDTDPYVISQHVEWSRQANIELWVTSWWGPGSREDTTTLDSILSHTDVMNNIKIALHYETTRLIGDDTVRFDRIATDMQYICENYFNHGNYFQIDGRPVLVMYLTRVLEDLGVLKQVIESMKLAAAASGYDNIYIIGDHAFNKPSADAESTAVDSGLAMLDAITNYDVYGATSPKGYTKQAGVDGYFAEQVQWIQLCAAIGLAYVPGVSPGFNDRGVRLEVDHAALSRKLSSKDVEGSLFRAILLRAVELVQESTSNLMLVNSFNEWHEDSQIEPVVGDTTTFPLLYTEGLEYVGYGELYLDILGDMTADLKE
jgi:glycoprotein endo-alpha-1,2-mannosidase